MTNGYVLPGFSHKFGANLWGIKTKLLLNSHALNTFLDEALNRNYFGIWAKASQDYDNKASSGLRGLEEPPHRPRKQVRGIRGLDDSLAEFDVYVEAKSGIPGIEDGMIDFFMSSCLGDDTCLPVFDYFVGVVRPIIVDVYEDRNVPYRHLSTEELRALPNRARSYRPNYSSANSELSLATSCG